VNRYPDRALLLAGALAERHAVDLSQVLLGNGADAIVGYLCSAYLERGDQVVMGWPSFVTYRLDTLRMGAEPVLVPLASGRYDLAAMAERIGDRTRMVFICNPNNPTGGIVKRRELENFLNAVPDRVLVVIDEAYFEYVSNQDYPNAIAEHAGRRPNVAVLRTFSKIYGLAGLRVGYMVASAAVVAAAGACRHWFDVSDLAHDAATASLGDNREVEWRREQTIQLRDELAGMLREAGLDPMPSHGNFVFAEVGDATAFAAALAANGVLVRELTYFGAPEAVRITVGSMDELDALRGALPVVA
jgi:histidinol-phosphate aminotransferase